MKAFRHEYMTVLVDQREKLVLNLEPLRTKVAVLATGDYSISGLEHLIAIERKGLADLVACVGQERDRFEREIQRLLAYPTRAVVVEATWADLEAGGWRSRVTPTSVVGSVLGWIGQGIPFLLAGDHAAAGRCVAKLLFLAARRRWRELQHFYNDQGGNRD